MSDAIPSSAPRPYVGSGRNGLITAEEARSLLDQQARSGLSLQAFARSLGIRPQRLSWWKSEFAGKHAPRARRPSPADAAAPRWLVRGAPVQPAGKGNRSICASSALTSRRSASRS